MREGAILGGSSEREEACKRLAHWSLPVPDQEVFPPIISTSAGLLLAGASFQAVRDQCPVLKF